MELVVGSLIGLLAGVALVWGRAEWRDRQHRKATLQRWDEAMAALDAREVR